jgi:hypothetical protein
MAEEKKDLVYDVVIDHELHGITIEMIAWWGANIEKGYPLWHPEDHISHTPFPVRPGEFAIAKEKMGDGPVMELRLQSTGLDEVVDLPIVYTDYVTVGGQPDLDSKVRSYLTHQYEATSYGVRGRSIMHREEGMPRKFAEAFRKHCTEEVGRFPEFLPQLWKMWQVVKNPEINRPPRMRKVKKLPNGQWAYES